MYIDIEYVTACQLLIKSLCSEEAVQAESYAEQSFEAVDAKLRQARHSVHKGRRLTIRCVLAAVCLLMVLAGADLLLTKRQIQVGYSPDHEQIVYDGMMTTLRIADTASAEIQGNAVQELTTKNWDEVVAFLGYEPEMPTRIPDGWKQNDYYCAVFESFSIFDAAYSHQASNKLLSYTIVRYFGSEPLHKTFEQDGIGYEVVTAAGKQIYISSNMGSSIVLWHSNSNIYSIIGPVAADELIYMIESMNDGNDSP